MLLIVLALAMPLVTGAVAAQDSVVINVLAMDHAGMTPDELSEIAARFEAANPGVTVEIQ